MDNAPTIQGVFLIILCRGLMVRRKRRFSVVESSQKWNPLTWHVRAVVIDATPVKVVYDAKILPNRATTPSFCSSYANLCCLNGKKPGDFSQQKIWHRF